MRNLFLILICVLCCSPCCAEGLRRGTIYIQPMIVEAADDNASVMLRISEDMVFMKRIYSQMGITIKDLPVKKLGKSMSVNSTLVDARLIAEDKLHTIKAAKVYHGGVEAVPLFYVPSIVSRNRNGGANIDWGALPGKTLAHGCFVSLKVPHTSKDIPIHSDTAAHEVLHLLLGAHFSFGEDSYYLLYIPYMYLNTFLGNYYHDYGFGHYLDLQVHHSKRLDDLLAPGNARDAPKTLKECAPLGRKDQIRNIEYFKNGQHKRLFDVVFDNTKYVKVEHCEQCRVSLDSGRTLYQYPSWLPEPETLIKVYTESLSANGKIELKTDEGNQAKSKPESTLPIVLRYTDLGQETQNSGGSVLGAQIQSKEPVVFNEPVSELIASIMIEDMTNFSNSRADGVIVLNANISPSIFSKTHPLEKSAIDRTARALQNNGRHELEITFSDLRLALPETLKDFSIVASGRGISKEGIEYEVFPDPASGPDRMAIKLRIKQQVGTNKPDLGKLSLRINSKFLITKGAIPSDQLLNLFKAWYFK